MATRRQTIFEINLTGDPADGRLRAVYVHVRKTKVARTEEVVEDTVLADRDSRGRLVGIEILGPCKIQVLLRLVGAEHREAFKRFARENIPPSFLQEAA